MTLTVLVVNGMSERLFAAKPGYNLLPVVAGPTPSDARTLLLVVIPLYLVEFLILTVPLACLMLVANRLVKTTAYTQSVMTLGTRFGGFRMTRRAVVPAMFALSSGDLLLSFVNNWPFQSDSTITGVLATTVLDPLLSLLSSMVVLPVALAILMPTWALDDSGIVSHLKPKQLENRRPPDTEGVGRWYNSYIGGFALLGYPITMFFRYFYRPFFLMAQPMTAPNIALSVFTTIGLPLLIMSFVMPVIILNELTLGWTTNIVRRLARRLGAREVQIERIAPVQSEQTPQSDDLKLS
ncbi:MAG: hypothetical protein C4K47_09025 [Candidatus Thorarchaeota archaeon]|nr:MAG: hypothetical protein C4K47_09025 [Candidatus Thorarchaeota archaeon]